MKLFSFLSAILLTAITLFGQSNYIDTSFYSPALNKEKMVRVYLPPGYVENHELHYPVIYFLHGTGGDHTSDSGVLPVVDSMVQVGRINPLIVVIADNSPEPYADSHFVNSIIWGNYEDFMTTDLITWVDPAFRTIPIRDARTLMGQSMGAMGSFRYGILHKEKFRALAAHAGCLDFFDPFWFDEVLTRLHKENQPGPPYFYDYEKSGSVTKLYLKWSAAYSPKLNSPQEYINPQIVEFPFDENGLPIDSIQKKWRRHNIMNLIEQLSPADSIGIFFGSGSKDYLRIYPMNVRFKSVLESPGLPYEFYDHDGGHGMPVGFMEQAFIFLDSLMVSSEKYVKMK
jgi:S-formylglutathione hydrolase